MGKRSKKRHPLPAEQVRCKNVSVKANAKEANKIAALAAQCNLSVSFYTLSRALGHRPGAILTTEERQQLAPLYAYIDDVNAYVNNLSNFSEKSLTGFYKRFPFMLDWLDDCIRMRDIVSSYLSSLEQPPRPPRRLRNADDEESMHPQ